MVVFMRRRQLAMAAAGVLAALALLLIVPGCQRGGGKTEPVKAADNAARVAYLEAGVAGDAGALETLSLLLPEDLSGTSGVQAVRLPAYTSQARSRMYNADPQSADTLPVSTLSNKVFMPESLL